MGASQALLLPSWKLSIPPTFWKELVWDVTQPRLCPAISSHMSTEPVTLILGPLQSDGDIKTS